MFDRSGETLVSHLRLTDRIVLKRLPALLEGVGGGDDPAAARLDPDAYEDEAAAQEFRRLVADELDAARREDRQTFERTLGAKSLTLDEAEAWVRVVGDARLVLAARSGITSENWEDDTRSDPQLALLGYLSYVQSSLIRALSES